MKKRFLARKRIPFFPLIPLVPLAFMAANVILFRRLFRRINAVEEALGV